MHVSDDTIMAAAALLRRIAIAAENSNHAGEVAAIRAIAAPALMKALQMLLPYASIDTPRGVIEQAETALRAARGDTATDLREVA